MNGLKNMDLKLTDKQTEATAYLEKESARYARMAVRLKEIGMPVLSQECERFSKSLRSTLDLQIRLILHPQDFLFKDQAQYSVADQEKEK
jgi:hypothetical protein